MSLSNDKDDIMSLLLSLFSTTTTQQQQEEETVLMGREMLSSPLPIQQQHQQQTNNMKTVVVGPAGCGKYVKDRRNCDYDNNDAPSLHTIPSPPCKIHSRQQRHTNNMMMSHIKLKLK